MNAFLINDSTGNKQAKKFITKKNNSLNKTFLSKSANLLGLMAKNTYITFLV
jgi:hypothetical protein